MSLLFYLSAGIGLVATLMAVTRRNVFHALLYLVVSFLAMALVFFSLGAPFVAALEVIVYAGAIMVLFVFVVMMLNLGEAAAKLEGTLLKSAGWVGPVILALALFVELIVALARTPITPGDEAAAMGPREVGLALFGPYVLAVELASFLLLAGLVGAYYIGIRARSRGGEA
ncbi:MAG: NADH-quinone oxidoreductase subunit J [Planctomycetota bacterium]|jgi:NADH-quinone oxidoreductase subunit J